MDLLYSLCTLRLQFVIQKANTNSDWPRQPSSPHGSSPLSGGGMRMRAVKYFLDYTSSRKRWGWLCAAPWENSGRREVTISWIICSPRGLGWSCAAPRIWPRSRCCFCCWELPLLWQVWMHPASLSSPAGNPGCSSRTCTACGHRRGNERKETLLQSRACHLLMWYWGRKHTLVLGACLYFFKLVIIGLQWQFPSKRLSRRSWH